MVSELTYRHMKMSDVKDVCAYVSDPRVSKYLTWKSYEDEKLVTEYVSKSSGKTAYPDEVLVIEYGGNVIGTVHIIARPGGAAQFGFGIMPSFWGKGYGRRIIADMVSYMKKKNWKKHCRVIWADAHRDNVWVKRQLVSTGFILQTGEVEPNRYRYTYSL